MYISPKYELPYNYIRRKTFNILRVEKKQFYNSLFFSSPTMVIFMTLSTEFYEAVTSFCG